ncbi:hypothetical protein HKO22_00610 [Peptoniphilus sp. AGMB00490]|uniref:Uncharacterized protein n=1 Tax=Peptoniphilus faecalis TaxID=2731255 RepID=A0A848RDZ0_9FIRM|nr:hypothetical protein [Peptoniphilus faecalis]NMW84245.1 hypothetical protein [Peptoniphilus faecalis]
MIYQEALKAMKNRSKVKAAGIVYKHINAIIFRKTESKEIIEIELQSNCQNSVTIVDIAQAEVSDES